MTTNKRKALKRHLEARLSTALDELEKLAVTAKSRTWTAEERLSERDHLKDATAATAGLEALKKGKKRPKVKKPPLTFDPPAPRSSEPYARVSQPSATPRLS